MKNPAGKIKEIKEFISRYFLGSKIKGRGRMYGTVSMVECQWELLDCISFMLMDIGSKSWPLFDWKAFLISEGYKEDRAALIIEKRDCADAYVELTVLRNEYEAWREDKMKDAESSEDKGVINPSETLDKIRRFTEKYSMDLKKDTIKYGSIEEVDSRWYVLDLLFFLMEDLDWGKEQISEGDFKISKGYEGKDMLAIIEEIQPKDPYVGLVKWRSEYEKWRDDKIKKLSP